MSFDLAALTQAIADHGRVVRVVVAAVAGSAPREAGAAMLVWADGQHGTIGGGALEYDAAATARRMLAEGSAARLTRAALGPTLGQCCGGSVSLLFEAYDAVALAPLAGQSVIARPLPGQPGDMPLALRRMLAEARGQGRATAPRIVSGWFAEPVTAPGRPLWIWGAGHVGRALVAVLSPLPDLAITWADSAPARFPDTIPPAVTCRWAANPADLVADAPPGAEHLILTYSHALDLELCHRLLQRGFASAGLIGSATKWARFQSRLAALGHSAAAIARITCPIGDPALGKHPQAIAVGVASALLSKKNAVTATRERAG